MDGFDAEATSVLVPAARVGDGHTLTHCQPNPTPQEITKTCTTVIRKVPS